MLPKSRAASALNAPGDVTAAVHEVRHVLHGFPSRGRLRIRDAGGYLLPPFGGHRRELHGGGEIQRLGSPELGGLRQRIEQGGADAAGFWNAPIWV